MKAQANNYLGLYGVTNAWTCVDIEPPSANAACVNAVQALDFIHAIEDVTGRSPLIYSNQKYIMEALGNPSWLADYWLWIAQWLYKVWPFWLFTDFESFLNTYAGKMPPFVRGKALEHKTVLWQFTPKGDAQKLCASALTHDPFYKYGIKEADLDVSTIEKAAFLDLMRGVGQPPAPVGVWYWITVSDRNVRATVNSITGKVMTTLHKNDRVEVTQLVNGVPGTWGRVIAYNHQGIETKMDGYVYMSSLVKV